MPLGIYGDLEEYICRRIHFMLKKELQPSIVPCCLSPASTVSRMLPLYGEIAFVFVFVFVSVFVSVSVLVFVSVSVFVLVSVSVECDLKAPHKLSGFQSVRYHVSICISVYQFFFCISVY